MPSPQASAPPRRSMLLEAATDLFAARGYHAVGIDDIGAAAGITGPGVYRHFASKQALLESLCDAAMGRMLEGAQHIPAQQPDAYAALQSLVDLHVALSDDVRRSLRARQRAYEQVWRQVVGALRDDREEEEVAVVVASTLALLNSTPLVDTHLSEERLGRLLRRTALSALLSRRTPGRR